ncbi:hypothetical protein GMMP15_910045 [Candidatus Magnetomoraceae bacterium gMMP-15]
MQSIRGIYTGKEIKPLEDIHVRPNVRVIITFLDEISNDTEREHDTESQGLTNHLKTKDENLFGIWRDHTEIKNIDEYVQKLRRGRF